MAYATGSGPNPTHDLAFLAPVATVSVLEGQQVLVISNRVLGTNSPTGAGDLELAICYERADGESSLQVVEGSQLHDLGINRFDRFPFTLSAVIENLGGGTYEVGLCGFTERGSTTSNAWNYNEGGSTSAIVSGEGFDPRSNARTAATPTPIDPAGTADGTPEASAGSQVYLPLGVR
jgi:hypothetical protein